MLTDMRDKNKSTFLRTVFRWTFLVFAAVYLITLIVAHSGAEYSEVRSMMQDEDREKLHREELAWELAVNKIIPDCLSYWNFLIAVILLGAALALFKIDKEEKEEATLTDSACLEFYRDIHFSDNNALGHSPQSNSAVYLVFRPYQVQKCISILKDYKFKAEILLAIQILLLALISNAQFCVYGLPYLGITLFQLLLIALSHGSSDQDIRVSSSWITYILIAYLPLDLFYHYVVHLLQESSKMDFDAVSVPGDTSFQQEGYQGIMLTTPSYVTFGLKMGLFIFECTKFKYSYDMGVVYDKLKEAYDSKDAVE